MRVLAVAMTALAFGSTESLAQWEHSAGPAQRVISDVPLTCTASLPAFDEVRKGEITSEVRVAAEYYLDPRNSEGTLEERRAKLDATVDRVFKAFLKKRTAEYRAVRCHYRGVDWNKPGQYSWKRLTAEPGFAFIPSTLKRTMNGDWKEGPKWGPNNSTLDWRTGGHRRSETFAEVDAEYLDMENRVIDELNAARRVLFDLGIPTKLPH